MAAPDESDDGSRPADAPEPLDRLVSAIVDAITPVVVERVTAEILARRQAEAERSAADAQAAGEHPEEVDAEADPGEVAHDEPLPEPRR